MRYEIHATAHSPESGYPAFPASVPGNVQNDFLQAFPAFCPHWQYADRYKKLIPMESWTWIYEIDVSQLVVPEGERLFFVTEGIDYRWELWLGDAVRLHRHEGMFTREDVDLTGLIFPDSRLWLKILPHPMRHHDAMDRTQADHCVKPPVAYGWDWHPRVIPSGIWDDTWFETRPVNFILRAEPRYTLAEDYRSVDFSVDYHLYRTTDDFYENLNLPFELTEEKLENALYTGNGKAQLTLIDPQGKECYSGPAYPITVENPQLWWCSGEGEQNLYTWILTTDSHSRTGKIGFRSIALVMNEKAWEEPHGFPKSRSHPPATLCLNGRRIFAKGSNYVNHQIWTGTVDADEYRQQIRLAKECNMNIFRCWGGSGVQKKEFYELCDAEGMLVWLEFPLACNLYPNERWYMMYLEREATAILKKYRHHPCIALLCGGNELFNSWSGMTDQSMPLRLLNKLTYDYAPEIPFLPTSPLDGMKHGGYTFLDRETGLDPFALFGSCHATAYTEFGCPGTADPDTLRTIIPPEELYPPKPGGAWQAHHGFQAWGEDAWLCPATLSRFGDVRDLESLCQTSAWLQGMGYKAIFEAARRQWPQCAMAINWCWCEPWPCAVNNSLIGYGGKIKPAYYDVQASLRPATPAVAVSKFMYAPGEDFVLTPWLLNDTQEALAAQVCVWVDWGDGVRRYFAVQNLKVQPKQNGAGTEVSLPLPQHLRKGRFTVAAQAWLQGELVENRYQFAIEEPNSVSAGGKSL